MLRNVARLAAGILVASAASLAVPLPAQAATCSSAHGVSVVVDFHQLGGGVQSFCDATGSGEYAAQQFADAGHTLTRVQREPGFVCRVDGTPSSDPCVNTPPSDAYWSLWWSDGKSGAWKYSSAGVDSLAVPAGGYVALSWQGQSSQAKPRVTPTAHASSSPSPSPTPGTPTPRPTRHAGHHASASPTAAATTNTPGGASAPSASPSGPSATASGSAHASHHRSAAAVHHASHRPSSHASATPEADVPANPATVPASSQPSSSSGLPGWLAPALVALVFLAGGTVAVVRRRRSGGS